MVDDVAAVAVYDAGQVEECAEQVDVADVYVPVAMGGGGLVESCSLERRFVRCAVQKAGGTQNPEGRRRRHRHDVLVEHHVGESPVAIQRVGALVVADGRHLPRLKPPVARSGGVVEVRPAVAPPPGVEFARRNGCHRKQPSQRNLRAVVPVFDVVHYLVSHVGLNPHALQDSPLFFFNFRFSCVSSAMTSLSAASLRW